MGTFNEMPGFGDPILSRPNDWFSGLANGYVGWDNQDAPGDTRFDSDKSAEIEFSDNPTSGSSRRLAA